MRPDARLPFLTREAPAIRGEVRAKIEDFLVEEIPAYLPCGSGTHTYLWIEKRGISTMEAARRLARALSRRENDIGYAGMKDARAVTRQYLSVEHCAEEQLAGLKVAGFEILSVSRHGNKLKTGHLKGNRFRIFLRGAGPDAMEDCRRVVDVLRMRGVPNYYGEQRFGRRGDTADVGFSLLKDDPEGAARVLFGMPRECDSSAEREAREAFDRRDSAAAAKGTGADRELLPVLRAIGKGTPAAKALRRLPKRLWLLYLNAAQSDLFNRVLARRIERLDILLPGDIAFIHASGAAFRVEDATAEAGRATRMEISPSGPLYGARMIEPDGEQVEIERAVLAESGLEIAHFRGPWARGTKGARRPLRVPLAEPSAEAAGEGIVLRFALPPGSYATCVLRELLKTGGEGEAES